MVQRVKISLDLPYDLDRRLRAEAGKQGISRAEALRRGAELWLSESGKSVARTHVASADETAEETATRLRKLLHGNEDDEL